MTTRSIILLEQSKNIQLRDVFDHFHIKYEKNFSYLLACPFPAHDDSTASLKVYTETNSFYCFGCKAAGGPAHFVKHYKNIPLEKALEYLSTNFGIQAKSLAKTFNVIRKKIYKEEPLYEAEVLIKLRETLIIKLTQRFQFLQLQEIDKQVMWNDILYFHDTFDLLSLKLKNDILDMESFDREVAVLVTNINAYWKEWRKKVFVYDAVSPLKLLMRL